VPPTRPAAGLLAALLLALGLATAGAAAAPTAAAQTPAPAGAAAEQPAAEAAAKPEAGPAKRTIWSRGPSPLAPETLEGASRELQEVGRGLAASARGLTRPGGSTAGARWVLVLALAIGLAAAGLLRRAARVGIDRLRESPLGGRRRALATGVLGALRDRAFSAVVPAALLIALEGLHARETTAGTLAVGALALFAAYRLGVALFPIVGRPFDPAGLGRSLTQPPYARLWRSGRNLYALTLLGAFLLLGNQDMSLEANLRAEVQLLFSLVVLVVLWRLASARTWLEIAGGEGMPAFRRLLLLVGRGALYLTAVVPAFASGLGYHTLSTAFLLNLLLSVVILLALGTFGAGVAHALRRLESAAPPEALAPVVTPQRISSATRMLAALVRGLAVTAGLVGVAAVWGLPLQRVWGVLGPVLFGFDVGGYRISLLALIAAVAVLVAAFYVGRWIRRRMLERMLPRMTSDAGLRNSIASLAYYVVLVIGVLLAVSVAGFDLTNLAIIAGALSVGIGFGLQNIVNNFVSGLILLFERPIRVGDVIDYQGQWAEVQEIRVRSTVIRTYDRSELIVPNSELVSTTVTNWTHSNKMARIVLEVGVAYGSDTERVRELLLQAAAEHPQVYTDPAPSVLFRNFGDSALEFQLRFFTHLDYYLAAPSDLRFRIDRMFRDEDITIPFPQRDIHLYREETEDAPQAPSGSGGQPPGPAAGSEAEQPS